MSDYGIESRPALEVRRTWHNPDGTPDEASSYTVGYISGRGADAMFEPNSDEAFDADELRSIADLMSDPP